MTMRPPRGSMIRNSASLHSWRGASRHIANTEKLHQIGSRTIQLTGCFLGGYTVLFSVCGKRQVDAGSMKLNSISTKCGIVKPAGMMKESLNISKPRHNMLDFPHPVVPCSAQLGVSCQAGAAVSSQGNPRNGSK